MATHSLILAWRIPWTEESDGLQSMGLDTTELDKTEHLSAAEFINLLKTESESHSVMPNSLQPHGLYSLWKAPGQNIEWVAFSFSRGSSQHRDRTQISHVGDGFFTS